MISYNKKQTLKSSNTGSGIFSSTEQRREGDNNDINMANLPNPNQSLASNQEMFKKVVKPSLYESSKYSG